MVKKHDERYKRIFSNPLFIQKLLESFVSEKFVDDLDFNRMKRLDKSFIDKNMRKKESDIVYEIYFRDSPIYLYLLLEFQSTVDINFCLVNCEYMEQFKEINRMSLRFLRYILELSESYGKNRKSNLYPSVFPLLIYNGKRKWTSEVNVSKLFERSIPEKFIPTFEYYPIIINTLPRTELLKIHNAVSALFYIENTESWEYDGGSVSPYETAIFSEWFNSFLNDLDKSIDVKLSENLLTDGGSKNLFAENLKKYSDDLIQKGLEKGLEKGIEKGIEKGKLEVAKKLFNSGSELLFISNVTGLSIEELKRELL